MIQRRFVASKSLTTTTTTYLPLLTAPDNLFPILRQQIGMSFSDVMLPFLGQLDFAVQVWARKPTCHGLLQATCKRQS